MKKNLLIASNNQADAKGTELAFQGIEDIRLLPSVYTGRDTIDTILARDVNILILDLFLHDLDGICVLDFIGKLNEDRRPLVFVTTALADDRLLQVIKDRVIYCFTKPLKYELIQLRVLEFLRVFERETEKADDVVDILESQIASGIRAIGVPAHLKGYYYLRDAIRIYAMSESPVDLSITNDIYPTVAKIYNTRPPLVEHAVRNAIEIAWTRGNMDTIHEYFGYTVNDYKGKPSNLEFVATMAQRALTYIRK
ncbi:MAG: sporulation initiation factor Spo0A C-terminal domain-containing protein [Eubacteriales bacterium]|nr:sporulation initiation factor Spo0A C-terminal domain-containing protein [Eubacteriales bacterium]